MNKYKQIINSGENLYNSTIIHRTVFKKRMSWSLQTDLYSEM